MTKAGGGSQWLPRVIGSCLIPLILMLSASSCASDVDPISESKMVLLVPSINAGWVGWCVVAIDPSFGGCPPGRYSPPVLAESWSSGGPPRETVGYALTTGQVAAVSFNGEPAIVTHIEAALPDGLRAIGFEIHGKSLLEESAVIPRFTPFNRKGEVIPQPKERSASRSGPIGMEVPVRDVGNPARPASGVCRIGIGHLDGLKADGGSVITRIASYSGLIGQGFLSCASTSYNLNGWPLLAGMLLNASHPGSTPPPLYGMKPLQGHPGIFEAPGGEQEEDMLARRVRGAWVVVSRAKLQQRLVLLEHLYGTVDI
jgi:hypothetical protein